MYLNANLSIAKDYDVIDIKSGLRIPFVYEADDNTGMFSMYLLDDNKEIVFKNDKCVLLEVIGNIKIVKKEYYNEKSKSN